MKSVTHMILIKFGGTCLSQKESALKPLKHSTLKNQIKQTFCRSGCDGNIKSIYFVERSKI
jgi:hypothetical protein